MWRHGHTARGTTRWFCPRCHVSSVRLRPDARQRHERQRLINWLAGKASLSELAIAKNVTRRALSKRFQPYFTKVMWRQLPLSIHTLILDGIYIHGRLLVALIGLTEKNEAYWRFAPRETAGAWGALFSDLPHPQVIVCDGQKGLSKAIKAWWPAVAIQRCHFHIAQQTRRLLTMRPKTEAGQEIKNLVCMLPRVKTADAIKQWQQIYQTWEARYAKLLSERTYHHDDLRTHWWYTHRNLRGVRSLIRGAYLHLFTYLHFPQTPNTTNDLEGGVNAGIAEALRLHRGLRIHQKKMLVSIFLTERNRQKKPTRKFS